MSSRACFFVVPMALAACSSTVTHPPSPTQDSGGAGVGGGSVTSTTTGGVGGTIEPVPAVLKVWAPDQTSVHVTFSTDLGDAAPLLEQLSITSPEVAPLEMTGISYDGAAKELVIATGKQKLGAMYALAIQGTGVVDGSTSFLAADTATFWAVDLSSFDEYELVAQRAGVGKTSVVYVEEGWDAGDVDYLLERFDTEIYPVETSIFGPASDIDENLRIVLLGLNGDGDYGGYFSPIDQLPEEDAVDLTGYHSNETDMLYLDVSQFGEIETTHVVPHEFSHLLYHASHGFMQEDWAWHNEGMAECAVHVVNGFNDWAVSVMLDDPTGELATGMSYVNWQYGNYAQYALAYHVLTYLAAQSGGVSAYAGIFALDGHPQSVDAWAMNALGKPLADAQRDFYVALWAQAPNGQFGFSGMIDFFGKPQTVPPNLGPLSLEPYSGAFLTVPGGSFDPPGTQGPNIVYGGVDGQGIVDLAAPLSVGGGALVVTNVSADFDQFTPQPAGVSTFPAPVKARAPAERDRAWLHPPPFDPRRMDRMIAWRDATRGR